MFKASSRSSKARVMTTLLLLAALLVPGCSMKETITYTGPVAADQITNGFPRLVDDEVLVNVSGTSTVGELRRVGGWFVVHPEHLARFVSNTDLLSKIRKTPEGIALISKLEASGGGK